MEMNITVWVFTIAFIGIADSGSRNGGTSSPKSTKAAGIPTQHVTLQNVWIRRVPSHTSVYAVLRNPILDLSKPTRTPRLHTTTIQPVPVMSRPFIVAPSIITDSGLPSSAFSSSASTRATEFDTASSTVPTQGSLVASSGKPLLPSTISLSKSPSKTSSPQYTTGRMLSKPPTEKRFTFTSQGLPAFSTSSDGVRTLPISSPVGGNPPKEAIRVVSNGSSSGVVIGVAIGSFATGFLTAGLVIKLYLRSRSKTYGRKDGSQLCHDGVRSSITETPVAMTESELYGNRAAEPEQSNCDDGVYTYVAY
ncbi:uncharacterized protein LOC135826101 [Sycon ciliatum]|uniref:uncharacterized protein LOC135826101 n=1 Tax=Sycon ciliatum TaxID=27933 RepID=UPI0031F64EED